MFSIVGLSLPYVVSVGNLPDVIARNSGYLSVIANVVVGIGFLGAGIIVKQGIHVRSVTTAATVWFVAAVGVLCGIGLMVFAAIITVLMIALLLIFRKLKVPLLIDKLEDKEK